MNLENKSIRLTASNKGEITSLYFNDVNIIREGNNTFDIVWPTTHTSVNFVVNSKNYIIPFHGFWNSLPFNEIKKHNCLIYEHNYIPDNKYPFPISIEHIIEIGNDVVTITTTFKNIGVETAYFNFGYHPYFNVDASSKLVLDTHQNFSVIDKNGKFWESDIVVDKISETMFQKDYSTLVIKDHKYKWIRLNYSNVDINIEHNFDSTQVWTGNKSEYICIEPWQGWNDLEYDSPADASQKRGMIHLEKNQSITKHMIINLKKLR